METKKPYIAIVFLLFMMVGNAQVGVNTQTPSTAASLHLESLNVRTMEYGGFKMPVVTEAQQASIPLSSTNNDDDGLMIFVNDPVTGKQCWEIYDAFAQLWRSIYCFNCNGDVLYAENFDAYVDNTGITGDSASNGDYPGGVSQWTLTSFQSFGSSIPDVPGTLLDDEDYALVIGGQLECRDTNGSLVFQSTAFPISGYDEVFISVDVSESGTLEYIPAFHANDFNCGENESDFVDISYSVDGGATFTEIPDFGGLGSTNHTLIDDLSSTVTVTQLVTGLSASTMILRIQLQNWAASEYYFIDNIEVTCN
ncbi:hypothetical protein [Altibacter sp. HG106]|uniref:hypothetical protein n=1 Tax=Altibacter sp. HG106 TaxID=3023937 RepID=UPI002350A166|nr:hypothetical protein [Altibacter sp. HG106]MDC7993502.1 hypothetical protein [Altibacter sp. HG106]